MGKQKEGMEGAPLNHALALAVALGPAFPTSCSYLDRTSCLPADASDVNNAPQSPPSDAFE